MNSILNLNPTSTAGKILNYIEHSFYSAAVDWYDSLNEDSKNTLRMMKMPTAMFKIYARKLKPNLSEPNLILKKRREKGRQRLTI